MAGAGFYLILRRSYGHLFVRCASYSIAIDAPGQRTLVDSCNCPTAQIPTESFILRTRTNLFISYSTLCLCGVHYLFIFLCFVLIQMLVDAVREIPRARNPTHSCLGGGMPRRHAGGILV